MDPLVKNWNALEPFFYNYVLSSVIASSDSTK